MIDTNSTNSAKSLTQFEVFSTATTIILIIGAGASGLLLAML